MGELSSDVNLEDWGKPTGLNQNRTIEGLWSIMMSTLENHDAYVDKIRSILKMWKANRGPFY